MKLIKQQRLLNFIDSGKYRVDIDAGCLYSYRAGKNSWDRLHGSINASGFRQHVLYPGRGKRPIMTIYEHVAIWIAGNGLFPAQGVIIHKDNDPSNNKLWNLCLIIPKQKHVRLCVAGQLTAELADEIWKLYSSGMTNHTRIAEKLLINRQKVRRALLKFKNIEDFRFDMEKNSIMAKAIRNKTQVA